MILYKLVGFCCCCLSTLDQAKEVPCASKGTAVHIPRTHTKVSTMVHIGNPKTRE